MQRGLRVSRLRMRRLGSVLLVGGACLAALGCGSEEETHSPSRAEGGGPTRIVEGITLKESRVGKPRWVLRADSALTFAGDERTILLGIEVLFYDESGDSVRSRLRAREGEVDADSKDLIARGNVIVETDEDQRLETEELRWDSQKEKVVSDKAVRIVDGGSVLTGIGIESDADLSSYKILSHVQGSIREQDLERSNRGGTGAAGDSTAGQ